MNILLTSAGRRTYMVDYFRKALNGEGLVFASNSQPSPALQCADEAFITPIIFSKDYIPYLLELCREKKIDLIVSFFDIDLPVLAAHRSEFEAVGTKVAVSDPEALKSCNDKYRMYETLRSSGVCTPETCLDPEEAAEKLNSGRMHWPVIVKPRFGMGSIGILKAFDEAELKAAFSMCAREVCSSYLRYESAAEADCVLLQELRSGNEYGLDVIGDLDGNYRTTIIRRKIAMRSGETDEAVVLGEDSEESKVLSELGSRLAGVFRPRGIMDVDVLMNPEEKIPYVIDINARFGGGYPFSHLAGADVPRAYVLWMQGKNEEADSCLKIQAGVHGYKDIALKMVRDTVKAK